MKTQVQKWGNSLALRIPKSFAAEAGLEKESTVELSLDAGNLVIRPVAKAAPNLKKMLAGITAENTHGEVKTGLATGKEVW